MNPRLISQRNSPKECILSPTPHKQTAAGLRLSAITLVLLLIPALLRAQEPLALVPSPSHHASGTHRPTHPTHPRFTGPRYPHRNRHRSQWGSRPRRQRRLENAAAHSRLTATTDASGIFTFTAVPPGTLTLNIVAIDFSSPAPRTIVAQPGQAIDLQEISLQLASVNSTVEAASLREIAEQQLRVEEKQRIFGVVPNFYASYVWNAAPLSPGQKFRLALRTSVDPFTFVAAGIAAGIEQAQNTYEQYGQGASGFAKRYGAAYADGVIGNMIGGAILPVVFHQDPRYFYKGTGSISSRALYAISTVFRARGDDGHWEPNYSNLLGDLRCRRHLQPLLSRRGPWRPDTPSTTPPSPSPAAPPAPWSRSSSSASSPAIPRPIVPPAPITLISDPHSRPRMLNPNVALIQSSASSGMKINDVRNVV